MNKTATDRDTLEEKLNDPTASPIPLPFEFLKEITSNFSKEEELGRGGYGVVYKGVLQSGKIIAVKKLGDLVDDDQFQKEITNLIEIKHQNVVQLVGYCAESRSEAIKLPSGIVMAQCTRSLLCFEYLGNKSLDEHLSVESCGLDWNKRYEIIKGICSGLHFLHGECHIVHLDLKPQNILMDDAMMPKIADFGLSRLLGAQKSQTIISGNRAGSLGYMAPEYLWHGIVSPKADIFSFGVIIIEIITGLKEYPMSTGSRQSTEMSLKEYKKKVIGRWRDMFKKEPKHTSLEIYTEQVERCITTALECVSCYSTRPTACDISQILTGEICSCQKKKKTLLSAQPFVLRFHFTDYHEEVSCPLQLTNNTDDVVAFRIVANDLEKYFPCPVHGLVLPRSMYTLHVALCRPLEDDNCFNIKLESTIIEQNQHPDIQAYDSDEYNRLFTEGEKKGREVQQVKLLFVITHEMIRSGHPASLVRQIFVHPTKTWIITLGSEGGCVNIWDYKKQQTVHSSEFLALDDCDIGAAVLIPRKQWFVVGSYSGHIKVYSYETTQEVKNFPAHEGPVISLDIHPSEPYVLSGSHYYYPPSVKLWNWEDWECLREIETSLAIFNPKDADYIAWTVPKGVKVSNVASPSSDDLAFCVGSSTTCRLEFLTCGDGLYLITGHENGDVMIWDCQRLNCLKTLKEHTGKVTTVCAHPDLPSVITGSLDGTICLWNTFTFQLEAKLKYGFQAVHDIACLEESNRIAIGHERGLAIAEIW